MSPGAYHPLVSQITSVTAATRSALPAPCISCVFWQHDRLVSDERRVLSGESWAHGQVILSWPDVLEGAAVADDGRNVVIHEFAHQLDQENGHANGAPDLAGFQRYPRWSRVLGQEFVHPGHLGRPGRLGSGEFG